jgi:putative addiction module antidote
MNLTIKLTRVGNSTGAVFPKELLARLRVGPGDTVYVSETPDGGVRLTASNPDFEAKMAAAEAIMREDRDILRDPYRRGAGLAGTRGRPRHP